MGGQAHAAFGAARRERRQDEAAQREADYARLSLKQKIHRAANAPGQSLKQIARLTSQLAAENNNQRKAA